MFIDPGGAMTHRVNIPAEGCLRNRHHLPSKRSLPSAADE
jgi:hypothetical protein